MTILTFIQRLHELNIKVQVDGEQLRYSAPLESITPEILIALNERKDELITFLKSSEINTLSPASFIPRRQHMEFIALSFAQERLWILEQIYPQSGAYNMPSVFRFTGFLDILALSTAVNEIICRHEIIRTVYQLHDNQPVQVIHPAEALKQPVVDLSRIPIQSVEIEVERLIKEETKIPFDISCEAMLRVLYLHVCETDHVLILTFHHIASDGWSHGIFWRELGTLYNAYREGRESPLPALEIQYADFAIWQRNLYADGIYQNQLYYWQQQLSGLSELLLPTDYPRPKIPSFHAASCTRKYPPSLLNKIKALCLQEGTTLYMTLLTVYQILLCRYTGQTDIAVGSPIANRTRKQVEDLIGFFVNTLVMRSDLSCNPTFITCLHRVKDVCLEAYTNQDLPFEKIVAELQPERHLNRNPLVQVTFALQNAPQSFIPLRGVESTLLSTMGERVRFDLECHADESSDGLTIIFQYCTDLFTEATINRIADSFEILLYNIVADPTQRVFALSIMPEEQKHRMVKVWNESTVEYPQSICIHELIQSWVQRTPDAIAVVFEGKQLTYRQLNNRANQLAYDLLSKGIQPDTRVAICVDRSLEMMVGVIGIMKSGAAYVPLDPLFPEERLKYMIHDSNVKVLVTNEKNRGKFGDIPIPVVNLANYHADFTERNIDNPVSKVCSDNLAYVLYTSGSTGLPKGVMISHRNVVGFLYSYKPVVNDEPHRIGTNVAIFSFDTSVEELFSPLCFGGTVHILRPENSTDAEYFARYLTDNHITTTYIVPQMLVSVSRYLRNIKISTDLKTVITGLEPKKESVLQSMRDVGESIRILNAYGPTEVTYGATAYEFSQLVDAERDVPIGVPFPNYQTYIVDEYLNPVQVGVTGELLIGGVGVARGYLDRPGLTAEKFIPDPFSGIAGQRLYCTGDLARYLPDGKIEFLGRADTQIKLHGYRIELGEIESMLSNHPLVKEAVVQMQGKNEKQHLVAYIGIESMIYPDQENDRLSQESIEQWHSLYDGLHQTIAQLHEGKEPVTLVTDDKFYGWDSSYTGSPIPYEEMREWLDYSVDNILSQNPKNVLDIGCGTGLLLFQIAPSCRHYVGTDFSQAALDYVTNHNASLENALTNVKLERRFAHDSLPYDLCVYDLVILNSVIQYFPDGDYLSLVIQGAVKNVTEGGCIFIGDVRSLQHLELFHCSVQAYKADSETTREELNSRVQAAILRERELVVDPCFFFALSACMPRIKNVVISLKRGHMVNELTKYRYDVTIYIGQATGKPVTIPWMDWQFDKVTLSGVKQKLLMDQPKYMGITNIPNARLYADMAILTWLHDNDQNETIGTIQNTQMFQKKQGLEPEELWDISTSLPYAIQIWWSQELGTFDAVFIRQLPEDESIHNITFNMPITKRQYGSLDAYVNSPCLGLLASQMSQKLRQFLSKQLPAYMIPSEFVVLDQLPRMANDKVDRLKLSVFHPFEIKQTEIYIPPQTETEKILERIWQDVLGLDRISVHDDFFVLGGHSLLATQVISRVRQLFNVELSFRSIFEETTISQLAAVIESMISSKP